MTQAPAKPVLDLLLVDDDLEMRQDVANYFARQGYRVEQVEDGEQALDLLERRSYDVMVLDLIMSGLSGLDV
jgi:DNA-binding response OmpR family regulator